MGNVLGELFSDIANAIREKTGDTATMKPNEFPAKISGIEAGGSSGGGGSLPAGLYWANDYDNQKTPCGYHQHWFVFNDVLYAYARNGTGAGNTGDMYKYANGAWTKVVTGYNFQSSVLGFYPIVFNGKVHIYGMESAYHHIYDGASSIVQAAAIPNRIDRNGAFVQGGKLKMYSCYDGNVYVWDESSDTWSVEATIGAKYQYWLFFEIDDTVYAYYNKKVYKYDNGTLTELFSTTNTLSSAYRCAIHNGYLYCYTGSGYHGHPLVKIDVKNGIDTKIGRTPPFYNANGLLSYRNQLRVYGGDSSYSISMIAHEVEATA